jgi:hypothetical protein
MMAIIALMLVGGAGCKSKKKAAEAAAAAAEKQRLEQEMADKQQRAEEEARRRAEEERLAAERARAERERANSPENKLNNYFNAIAKAGNSTSANRSIQEAMSMFASPETPVLIVISEEGDQKDYDEPTTISKYLNYLKDTGNNMNRIKEIEYDASGKITVLELVKDL